MKTTKRFIAALTAIVSVMAIAPMSAFADDTVINQGSTGKTGGMVVSYSKSQVSPAYTITIPASVDLNSTSRNTTIKAEDVYLDTTKHSKINVRLDSASNTTSGSMFHAKNTTGDSTATYSISKGETAVAVGDTVAEFTKDGTATLTFSEPTGATYAGTHTETLTFGISVESAETIVDLSTLTADYVAKDGETLTGTLAANVKISIADGATVTLKDANITNLGKNCDWAGINCPNDATIILKGTNTICAGRDSEDYNNYPGIWIASGKTLTIDGDGSLTAYSNDTNPSGAGIGGGYQVNCGNIVINGGTITATGGIGAAGIGSGDSSCDNITINGGTITATGGDGAAGIGSGQKAYSNASCGKITIANTVTKVTATKGKYDTRAYSIGAGGGGVCGTVTIGGVEGAISESPYTYEP